MVVPQNILNPKGCMKETLNLNGEVIEICRIAPNEVFIEKAINITKDGLKGLRELCDAPSIEFKLCPQCQNIQKAQAQTLLDEKKSELEFLEPYTDYTNNFMHSLIIKSINKIQELQEEIKVLEGVI